MAEILRSAHVPYSAADMLALVNDIGSYPKFLHWCLAARIERSEGAEVEAALDIGISGIHKTMRTRNRTLVPVDGGTASIEIEMIDGPLKRLRGAWTFVDRQAGGSDVTLGLDYEVHRTPFGFLLRTVFDEIANSQLNAFVRRAAVVYGSR